MTSAEVRRLTLGLPDAVESADMDHPDFRVGGKIGASLGPKGDWGMVKLTPDQQAPLVRGEPDVYKPAAGAWGAKGATIVTLETADWEGVRTVLRIAWRNTAPKRLVRQLDESL